MTIINRRAILLSSGLLARPAQAATTVPPPLSASEAQRRTAGLRPGQPGRSDPGREPRARQDRTNW